MSKTAKEILDITSSEYKYGFTTDIKEDRITDGLNESTVEVILGFGKKQLFETLKCFFISSLQFDKTDNLLNSFVCVFAIILSATSF